MSAKLMTVIVTDMECRGKGVDGDPCRRITQYWTPDGTLLVEKDPCPPDELFAIPAIPEQRETCKWKKSGDSIENPHFQIEGHLAYMPLNSIDLDKFCIRCGMKIEVVE